MAALVPETARRIFTPETLRSAARQSEGCHVVSLRLRRAIKKFLREQEEPHMKNKVFRLSQSFNEIKGVNLLLTASTSRELVEDPLKSMEQSKRWKIKSAYGDIGLTYRDHETVAYVASRMPAVYSACFRVLSEVRRRLPGFSPAAVLDFGSGTGSALWALREVWPDTLERINLVEPSKSMQRVSQRLLQDQKNLPLIHSYDSIQALAQKISKSEREHDLVIASYVLGEIPSLKDRITIVRQLWDLTRDVLVLVEPGTPQGSSIISQMRSHILWMEKRRIRKKKAVSDEVSKDKMAVKAGAYIVAPCPHDGVCPLEKTTKYCHFVQRLQRTTSQRAYKRSRGEPLRGFEDEKFCFVAFRRGQRPWEPWPLDGMKFETLEEQRAKRNLEDLEIDYEDQFHLEEEDTLLLEDPVSYDSDVIETDAIDDVNDEEKEKEEKEILREEETTGAELGSGWGRIIFSPVRRGKQVAMNVCRATNREGTQGSFERMVVTQSENPKLHLQARRSLWGDLWPF